MKTGLELYNEHLQRINTAVALEKPDRTPVILMADAFCAKHMGVKLSEFCMNPILANQTMIESFAALGDIDALEKPYTYAPSIGAAFYSKMLIPGRELPEDEPWQVDEVGLAVYCRRLRYYYCQRMELLRKRLLSK